MKVKKATVEKIANGGWGLVRSDEGVVFLNYVLPGEQVAYRIEEKAKGILWGRVEEIRAPSEHRIEPPCPYFGECGGCVFQHIDYPFQQTIKRDILLDDLKRIGHFEGTVSNYLQSPPYHNRIRARMKAREDGKIGFIRKGTTTVIPIRKCLLFPEEINRFLEKWNSLESPPFFHQMDILVNNVSRNLYIHLSHPPKKGNEVPAMFDDIIFSWKGHQDAAVSELSIKEWTYLVSPTVFFQVNPYQWENMLNTVGSYLEPCDTIIDLYSGVGFFIPLLRKYAQKTIGVESQGFSVTLAGRAFPGVDFFKLPAEKFSFPDADIIVVDPPRSGLGKHVMKGILRRNYKKVIYISCSSATFSRDLKVLLENGYVIRDLNIIDLFPQTAHLETISLFVK
jgi:23S rRNA (uracil1939-C5)-methyltransferase